MSNGLKELFANSQSALAAHPEQAAATFSVESKGHGGLFRRVRIRDFTVEVDEPAAHGGSHRPPKPGGYALAGEATCQE